MRTLSGFLPFTLACLLAPACAEAPGAGAPVGDAENALPAGHPALAAPDPDARSFEGEVVETMDAGGYTYALLRTAEGEVWVAAPLATVRVGRAVAVYGATPMGSFSSPSLGRTFDQIFFAGAYVDPYPPEDGLRGVARQVLNAPGYAYVRAEREGELFWIAAPETAVAEGDVVVWVGGTPMGQFTSTALGRTFEDILFVEQLWVDRR